MPKLNQPSSHGAIPGFGVGWLGTIIGAIGAFCAPALEIGTNKPAATENAATQEQRTVLVPRQSTQKVKQGPSSKARSHHTLQPVNGSCCQSATYEKTRT